MRRPTGSRQTAETLAQCRQLHPSAANQRSASLRCTVPSATCSKYVREYKGGLYVAYNGKHHETPYNAVTVSEVRFHCIALHCLTSRSRPAMEDWA